MLTIIATLAVGVPLSTPRINLTEQIVESTDCAPRSIAGRTVTICDLIPAIERATVACEGQLDRTWNAQLTKGCHFVIDDGLYYLSRAIGDNAPLEVCYGHRFEAHDATIYVAPAASALTLHGYGWCDAQGANDHNHGFEVSGLHLISLGNSTSSPVYGIFSEVPIDAERIDITGFTVGVRIDAGVARPGAASNANHFLLHRVQTYGSKHAGFIIDGPDTNAGLLTVPSSVNDCAEASQWDAAIGRPCRGIDEGSFLGNTIIAGHVAGAKEGTGATGVAYPAYSLGDSANSRAVCVGCYAEGGQGANLLGSVANTLGGKSEWNLAESNGKGWISGRRYGGIEINNSIDPNNPVSVLIGLEGGTFLNLRPEQLTGGQPLRFRLERDQKAVRVDVANLNSAIVWRMTVAAGSVTGGSTFSLGDLRLRPTSFLGFTDAVHVAGTP